MAEKPSLYTVRMPRNLYLRVREYAAHKSVMKRRRVTINEALNELVEKGLDRKRG